MGRAVHTFGAVTTDMARRVPQKHGGVLTIAEKGDVLNKRGRPRLTTTINKELEAEGVSPVGRKEIMDIIARLQNLPRKKLLAYLKDDADTPVVVALIAKGMLGKDGPDFLMRALMDRQFGRPAQEAQITVKGTVPAPLILIQPPMIDAATDTGETEAE